MTTQSTSSLPLWVQGLAFIALSIAQLTACSLLGWGIPMFVVPGFVLLAVLLVARPVRVLPEDQVSVDWGRTLGHGWIVDQQGTTWFVPLERMRASSADPTPIALDPTIDGFNVRLHPAATGYPPIKTVAGWMCMLLIQPPLVYFVTILFFWRHTQWGLVGAVALALAWALASIPLVLAALGALSFAGMVEPGRVRLQGQILSFRGKRFTLGQPFQTIEVLGSNLVLENESERLVVWGRAAELRALHDELSTQFPAQQLETIPKQAEALRQASRRSQAQRDR